MMISFINLQAIIQWGYKTTSKISYDILRNYFKDKMFKIGDAETKISVTTWNGAVRIHFRKFYHSKFNHTKWYPLRQGIALTLEEWRDLKALIQEVSLVATCTQIMLDRDYDGEVGVLRAPFQQQFDVNEEEDQSNPLEVNEDVLKGIVRGSEETQENKKIKLPPPRTLTLMLILLSSFKCELKRLFVIRRKRTFHVLITLRDITKRFERNTSVCCCFLLLI